MINKTMFKVFFIVLMSMIWTRGYAYDIAISENYRNTIYYNIVSGNELEVTNNGEKCYSGKIVIPEEVSYEGNKYIVTRIGAGAFKNCELSYVVIPKSVTSIMNGAFYGCKYLNTVIIGEGVTYIGDEAFYRCDKLTQFTILCRIPPQVEEHTFYMYTTNYEDCILRVPDECKDSYMTTEYWKKFKNVVEFDYDIAVENEDNVTIYYKYINEKELKVTRGIDYSGSIVIPQEVKYEGKNYYVTEIGYGAFQNCLDLWKISIPYTVKSIGNKAFYQCNSLLDVNSKNPVPPEVKKETFYMYTSNYEKGQLFVPKGCKEAYQKASYWKKFKNVFEYGYTITAKNSDNVYLNYNFINDNTELEVAPEGTAIIGNRTVYRDAIIIPEDVSFLGEKYKVTRIGEGAFYLCKYLTSVSIPNSVTSIGAVAFKDCGLNSITIPSSITAIGSYVFRGSNPSVVVSEMANPIPVDDIFEQNTYENSILYVPKGTIDLYNSTEGWNNFMNIVDTDPTGINKVMFNGGKNALIFDLYGRQLSQPQKGINIINGKKVIVK